MAGLLSCHLLAAASRGAIALLPLGSRLRSYSLVLVPKLMVRSCIQGQAGGTMAAGVMLREAGGERGVGLKHQCPVYLTAGFWKGPINDLAEALGCDL